MSMKPVPTRYGITQGVPETTSSQVPATRHGTPGRGTPNQNCGRFLDPLDRARLAHPADSQLRRREKVAFIWASVANSPASACLRTSRT